MAFHLSTQIRSDNKNTDSSVRQNRALPSEGGSRQYTSGEVRRFLAGQTLSGEIVAVREGEVDIALSKDIVITAKLDREMQLFVGQTMSFEVKSNHNAQISLRPLFENLSQNPNVLNAIGASHIPLNNKSMAMVSSLMEQGMPIDKQSLQNLYKQLAANPEANPVTLIQMNRLHIPVTPENIQQFENYKNYEHSLKNGVETVAEEVLKMMGEILDTGNGQEARALFQRLTAIFAEGMQPPDSQGTLPAGMKVVVTEDGTVLRMPNQEPLLSGPPSEPELPSKEARLLQEAMQQQDVTSGKTADAVKQAVKDVLVQESVAMMQQFGKEKEAALQQTAVTVRPEEQKAADKVIMKVAEILSEYTQEQGMKEIAAKTGQSLLGLLTPEDTLKLVNQLLLKGSFGEGQEMKQLLGSKEVSLLLKTQITRQWMLEPEQVGQEGKVEELYDRVQKQTAKLSQAILEMAKDNTPLAKSVTNLSKNVDFLNQLNQTLTYVQLPIKMSRENAHGDLYVYTNKKNLAQKDGKVSALLHLDMEYLGTMDIYVAMENEKVSTKFYLEKEEYLDFIEKHLPMLDDRLEKRGYSMNSEVHLSEKKVNVVEEMLEQDKNAGLISKYSFDVRA